MNNLLQRVYNYDSYFREQAPISSSLNAVDLYLVVCIFFVFAALIEYAVILLLLKKRRKPRRTIDEGLMTMFQNTAAPTATGASNGAGEGPSTGPSPGQQQSVRDKKVPVRQTQTQTPHIPRIVVTDEVTSVVNMLPRARTKN